MVSTRFLNALHENTKNRKACNLAKATEYVNKDVAFFKKINLFYPEGSRILYGASAANSVGLSN
jgi:hypothetical protein